MTDRYYQEFPHVKDYGPAAEIHYCFLEMPDPRVINDLNIFDDHPFEILARCECKRLYKFLKIYDRWQWAQEIRPEKYTHSDIFNWKDSSTIISKVTYMESPKDILKAYYKAKFAEIPTIFNEIGDFSDVK